MTARQLTGAPIARNRGTETARASLDGRTVALAGGIGEELLASIFG